MKTEKTEHSGQKKLSPLNKDQMLEDAFGFFDAGDYLKVIELGKLLIEIDNNDHRILYLLGCSIQRLGNPALGIKYLAQAVIRNPNNADYYLNAGIAALDARLPERETAFYLNNAIRLEPGSGVTLFHLARMHTRQYRHHEAKESLKKALALSPDIVDIYELLSLILDRTNDLEEMEEILEDGLERFPNDIRLMLPMAKLKRRQKDFGSALSYLSKIDNVGTAKERQSSVKAEYAKIYDAKKEYDKAFEYYSKSQKLLQEAYEEKGVSDTYMEIRNASVSGITADIIKSWNKEDIGDGAPPLFLVGFPRSGTTLLEQILSAHPSLLTSEEAPIIDSIVLRMGNILGRKINFPQDLSGLTRQEITFLRRDYRENISFLFEDKAENKDIIDKQPFNISHLGFIYRIFPEAKVLVLLRDPRDACLSCFMQTFRNNSAMRYSHTLESTAFLYDKTMGAYLHFKKFLPISVMEVRYEDLVSDLENNIRKILEFYGQEWNDDVLNYYEKTRDRGVATPSYEGVMKPVYKSAIGRWKNYEKYFKEVNKVFEPYIKEFGYDL